MMSRHVLGPLGCAAAWLALGTPASPAQAAPRYVLRSLALPTGVALPPATIRPLAPPLALAANGAVAAVVTDAAHPYFPGHIVVWRADGTRTMLELPSEEVLATALRHKVINTSRAFPDTSFEHVVLASDGTPFATVTSFFSGAYSGNDKGIFRWTGTRWSVVEAFGHREYDGTPTDYDVVGAELPRLRVALTADYSGLFVNYDAAERDPNYQMPEAWILEGTVTHKLGFGRMTSFAGAFACGYISYASVRPIPETPSAARLQPIALLWRNGRGSRLGPGVALGVDAQGAAVGDDRTTLDGSKQIITRTGNNTMVFNRPGLPDGVPTLWKGGTATALSKHTGTAYAIARDGTIVGTLTDGTGFVVRNRSLRKLDTLFARTPRDPIVAGAYAINAHGRIAVLTVRNGVRGVAVLDPVP